MFRKATPEMAAHVRAAVNFYLTAILVVAVAWFPFLATGINDCLGFFFGSGAVLAGLGCIYLYLGFLVLTGTFGLFLFVLVHSFCAVRSALQGELYVYPFSYVFFRV